MVSTENGIGADGGDAENKPEIKHVTELIRFFMLVGHKSSLLFALTSLKGCRCLLPVKYAAESKNVNSLLIRLRAAPAVTARLILTLWKPIA